MKTKICATCVAKAATLVIKYLDKNLLHNQSISINKNNKINQSINQSII